MAYSGRHMVSDKGIGVVLNHRPVYKENEFKTTNIIQGKNK